MCVGRFTVLLASINFTVNHQKKTTTQTARVKKLKAENAMLKEKLGSLSKELAETKLCHAKELVLKVGRLEAAESALERAMEALEFYSNPRNWERRPVYLEGHSEYCNHFECQTDLDQGMKAKAALSSLPSSPAEAKAGSEEMNADYKWANQVIEQRAAHQKEFPDQSQGGQE